jgi:hypothetical protein
MRSPAQIFLTLILTQILTLGLSAAAAAQGKTDVVVLGNGDRITGEIKRLDRGQLEFSTDDAGTLYLEWEKLASAITKQIVEVVTKDGSRLLGSLGPSAPRSITVVRAEGDASLPMTEVTNIAPIGQSFWRKLDGSFDAGFNYTQSSGIAQLNVNSNTLYRRPGFQARVLTSLTGTRTEDSDRDDRGMLEMSYLRYVRRRWFSVVAGRFETNESLGLTLRSQVGVALGPRLVNTNRAQLAVGAGLVLNEEDGVDVEPVENVEGLLVFQSSYYTYDRPKTNLDLNIQYYPSLSNTGRHRLQLDAGVKREVWVDLFVALNVYNTYDSRPPSATADTNDVGIVTSIGWSY